MAALQPGDRHYCHNCHYMSRLADGIWCDFCTEFRRIHGRWPEYGERLPTTMELLYARMGWSLT